MKMEWKHLVRLVDQLFDSVVREDDEEFIICPECGEPIYEEDYNGDNLCPCCEFNFLEM